MYIAKHAPLAASHIHIATACDGLAVRWRGLITPATITRCLTACRRIKSEHGSSVPFVSLTVHGCIDAPVSWLLPSSFEARTHDGPQRKAHFHHDFLLSGEHHYAYTLLDEAQYWQFQALGPLDECS